MSIAFENLPKDVPIALFPVRVETRFMANVPDSGQNELWVRVFPDRIAYHAHEEDLTEGEIADGEHFWSTKAAYSDERATSVWNQLASDYGPHRASWIIRHRWPSSYEVDGTPNFPPTQSKTEAWTRPPIAELLPSFWEVRGYRNGIVEAQGRSAEVSLSTDGGLAMAPPPESTDFVTPDSDWLVKFDKAVDKGMAIRLPLSQENWDLGFDELVVVGVDETLTPTGGSDKVARVFDAHYLDDELSFLQPTTPTNNTQSGRSNEDTAQSKRYRLAATREKWNFDGGRDAKNEYANRMRRAFGIDDSSESALSVLRNEDDRSHDWAGVVQQILWPGTWGYFFEHVLQLNLEVSSFDQTTGDWVGRGFRGVEDFFWRHVRPDGPLPSLRVGSQPYGVLPATSLTGFSVMNTTLSSGKVKPVGPSSQAVTALKNLRDTWSQQADGVPRLGSTSNAEADFIKGLQVEPFASKINLRGIISFAAYEELVRTNRWDPSLFAWLGDAHQDILQKMEELGLSGLDYRQGVNNEPRLSQLLPLCAIRKDVEPVIIEAEDQVHAFPDYLGWLADASYEQIIGDAAGFLDGSHTLPLFALLARHSALNVLYSTALRFLRRWKDMGFTSIDVSQFEPDIYDRPIWDENDQRYAPNPEPSASIWEVLKTPLESIDVPAGTDATMLDFLEQVRRDPLAASENFADIFRYDVAREYIRFWLNMCLFSENQRTWLENNDFGQAFEVLAQDYEHINALDIPTELDSGSLSKKDARRHVLASLGTATDRLDSWVTVVADRGK